MKFKQQKKPGKEAYEGLPSGGKDLTLSIHKKRSYQLGGCKEELKATGYPQDFEYKELHLQAGTIFTNGRG